MNSEFSSKFETGNMQLPIAHFYVFAKETF